MEARVSRVEREVERIANDIHSVGEDVHDVKESVAVLQDRQKRFHHDMRTLTEALAEATTEVNKLNTWVNKRGAFLAGATFVIGIFASILTGFLAFMKDWFSG